MIKNLETVLQRIQECGSQSVFLVHHNGSEFLELPKCCDNRICTNPDCQKHRGYLHTRNHHAQMQYAKKYIENPKSFVFTGWRLTLSPQEFRTFAQEKLTKLFWVLKSINENRINQGYKPSPYCIFMEFKLYGDGSKYLHFHVITGTVGDIHKAQGLWGRYVRYEYPLVDNVQIVGYVRKYTGKTPVVYLSSEQKQPLHENEVLQRDYLEIVYKLQMARYSEQRKKVIEFLEKHGISVTYKSEWFSEEQLKYEVRRAYNRGRARREDGSPRDYVPYIDDTHDPSSDIPSCVKVYSYYPSDEELTLMYKSREEKLNERRKKQEKKASNNLR